MRGRVKFKDFSRTFKVMCQQIQGLNTEEKGVWVMVEGHRSRVISRGSRVIGRGSKVEGQKSRSRVKSRGRGSKVKGRKSKILNFYPF
jgi:hypothetical protein